MDIRKQDTDQAKNQLSSGQVGRRGHLKIFFGYASGVGKTYAMLKAARGAKHHGVDAVVGTMGAHLSAQTDALLDGFDRLPLSKEEGSSESAPEIDLDSAIRRRPQLILIDELAHTNREGSRHIKRYQDVEELLNAGIDVYTTVNVENIESLNDMVASILGDAGTERIPDSVFDSADQVKLIDIEPRELLERRSIDTAYALDSAKELTLEKLTALRELALRRCADRVDLLTDSEGNAENMHFHAGEHILVCLSSAPSNPKIIRTAARMAAAFKGTFTALFVSTPEFDLMSEENKKRLRDNARLAQQLGAQIETVYGNDIPFQISEFARLSNVTKIVIGRSTATRKWMIGKPALTERLIENAPNLDIHIIPDTVEAQGNRPRKIRKIRSTIAVSIADLGKSTGILLLSTLIGFLFSHLGFTDANIITIYILAVLIISIVTDSQIYSFAASLVSVLVFNFFFTVPRLTFRAYDSGYPVTFAVMFLAAFIMGSLASRLKEHARQSAQAAYRTKVLLDTNQLLQRTDGKKEILTATAQQLVKLLNRQVVAYLAKEEELEEPQAFSAGAEKVDEGCTSEEERDVAAWVLKNNKHAGATTDTFSGAKCLYFAVRAGNQVYGVIGIVIAGQPIDLFENSVLLSILGECALALENEKNAREKEEAAVLAKNEQLRANLLRAISHDLRTPLTSISGNASNLMSNGADFDEGTRKQIYSDIYDDSMWLINLVENLLYVTRIEDGRMSLNLNAELMDEVVAEALRHVDRKIDAHTVTVHSAEDYLLARMDSKLIVQVIINIVNNAVKYTQEGSAIEIAMERRNDRIIVRIGDDGPGISDEAKQHIFEMFYTGKNKIADGRRSLGLGLFLCKAIVQAHGGEIFVQDNVPKGTVFVFTLPAEKVNLHE